MSIKPYMKNRYTWLAHSVAWVNRENLKDGKFPNGRKMTAEDRRNCEEQIREAEDYLLRAGITKQGELF